MCLCPNGNIHRMEEDNKLQKISTERLLRMKALITLLVAAQMSLLQKYIREFFSPPGLIYSATFNQIQSIFELDLSFAGLSMHTAFGSLLLSFEVILLMRQIKGQS